MSTCGLFTYQYDSAGRLHWLDNPQSERTTFTYGQADRLLVKELANGTRTTHVYDADGRLANLYHVTSDNTALDVLTYDYNNVGVRTGLVETYGHVTTWIYDETYQLAVEWRSGPSVLDWETLTCYRLNGSNGHRR